MSVLTVGFCLPAVAEPNASYKLNIQSRNLSSALTQFAAQADLQILFDPRITDSITKVQLTGTYTTSDALDKLIAGTNLEYVTNNHIIILRKKNNLIDRPQDGDKSTEKESLQNKNAIPYEIVVTGTPGGTELDKQALSFAVSTASAQKIEQRAPQNTADLFKAIPGLWVESSGGVAGANIDVRGFPGGSDSPFVSVAINSMPVYPAASLSFMDNSALFRLDETIERLEGLRGGPSPIYSNGQPGLTANFLLKEGHDQPEGGIKYTTSDNELNRIDAWASGPLTETVYYMLGGYGSSSPGIRDTGFVSEEGYQFTGELSWHSAYGKINLFHRATDDHGIWYVAGGSSLGTSYTQLGPHNHLVTTIQEVFNPLGIDRVYNTDPDGSGPLAKGDVAPSGDGIPDPELVAKSYNLTNGRGWKGFIQGFSAELALTDNWVAIERLSRTQGQADTYSLLGQGEAINLGSLNGGRDGITISGKPVPASAMVQLFGPWVVQKEVGASINELTLNKTWEQHQFTLGHYFASWNSADAWSLGKQKYYEQKHDGELIHPSSISNPCQAPQAITCNWTYDLQAQGDATESAFYTVGKTRLEQITLDAGARVSRYRSLYSFNEGVEAYQSRFLEDSQTLPTYTAAISWDINPAQGIFFRINSGFSLPKFDDYRNHAQDLKNHVDLTTYIEQKELGYKFSQDNYSLFATAFYNHTQLPPECTLVSCEGPETRALGLEIEATAAAGNFSLDFIATLQSAKIISTLNKGNQVLRQPEYQLTLSPNYHFHEWNGLAIMGYGEISLIGNRYSNNANTFLLPGFTKVNAGIQAKLEKISFRIFIDNLTNQKGIDEGERLNSSQTNVRYILPRNIKLSMSYDF